MVGVQQSRNEMPFYRLSVPPSLALSICRFYPPLTQYSRSSRLNYGISWARYYAKMEEGKGKFTSHCYIAYEYIQRVSKVGSMLYKSTSRYVWWIMQNFSPYTSKTSTLFSSPSHSFRRSMGSVVDCLANGSWPTVRPMIWPIVRLSHEGAWLDEMMHTREI